MNGPLLVIDASTYRGTAAVIDGSRVLAEIETAMRGETEERLMPAVATVIARGGMALAGLRGVVCGAGPGSFTSLRIAASIAKALALGAGIELFAVPSLLLLIGGQETPTPGRYLAVLDAMRDQVFMSRGAVGPDGQAVLESGAELVDTAAAAAIAQVEGRTIVGPHCSPSWAPHARAVARVADRNGVLERVELESWEPSYGRLAEAQVTWERIHGRTLAT